LWACLKKTYRDYTKGKNISLFSNKWKTRGFPD